MSGFNPFFNSDMESLPEVEISAEFYIQGRSEPLFHVLALTVVLTEEAAEHEVSHHISTLMDGTSGFLESMLDSGSEPIIELRTKDNGRVAFKTDRLDAFTLYPPSVESVQAVIDAFGENA